MNRRTFLKIAGITVACPALPLPAAKKIPIRLTKKKLHVLKPGEDPTPYKYGLTLKNGNIIEFDREDVDDIIKIHQLSKKEYTEYINAHWS